MSDEELAEGVQQVVKVNGPNEAEFRVETSEEECTLRLDLEAVDSLSTALIRAGMQMEDLQHEQ